MLSPLLFLFYINGLVKAIEEINNGVDHALFADDASIWTTRRDLKELQARLQETLKVIEEWSKRKKMELNPKKSEATFFTTDNHEASWSLDIYKKKHLQA